MENTHKCCHVCPPKICRMGFIVDYAHKQFPSWKQEKKLIMSCRLMQPCNQPTKCRMGFIVDHSRAIPRKKIEKEKTNDVMSFDVTCKIVRFLSTVGHGIVRHKSHTGFGLKYRLVSDTQSSSPEDPHNPHVHPHHRIRGSYV